MAIEVSSLGAVCFKCGKAYSRRKGFFPVNYSQLNKGIGHTPICKDCIDNMYDTYLSQCNDAKTAVRQMCRKLDLYWNESVYENVERKSTTRSMMTNYIAKINTVTFAGKCYDDTLSSEGTLWSFDTQGSQEQNYNINQPISNIDTEQINDTVSEDIVEFWGSGYTSEMYKELEQRREYWMSGYPEGTILDKGTETLLRQACYLELDINKARIEGKATDKLINALNTVLGSANLKPAQKKDELDSSIANTPMGVWLYRYENLRPLPEIDDDLKDVNGLKKYIFTWMGHLCKMLNIKNGYTKLYEDEINRLRVEKPEYDEEDDETVLIDAYSDIVEDNQE